jgi:hypothetical protein
MDTRSAYRAAWTKCHGFTPHHELSEEDVAVLETVVEMLNRPKRRYQPSEAVYFLTVLVAMLAFVYVLAIIFGWARMPLITT